MRPRSVALFVILALALVLALPGTGPGADSARAGTAHRMEIAELVQGAGLVLAGRVVERRGLQSPSGRIDTEYTLEVESTFWGEPLTRRVVRLPGGRLPDGRGMVVPGVPSLELGEEALILLSDAGADGLRMPVGLSQGRFRILTGADGQRLAVRSAGGAGLAQPGQRVGDAGAFLMDYAELVGEVVRAVEERRARGESPRPEEGR